MPPGFQDITLAIFTTLAPAGTLAFIMVSIAILTPFHLDKTDDIQLQENHKILAKLDQFLVLPLTVVIVGLVTSATHLGNPANALYLFRGVGRSPLSTEVFCGIVFLLLGGIYWLQAFSLKPRPTLRKIWLSVTIVAALAFVVSMMMAYSAHTILSWNTIYVPASLLTAALMGASILAMITLQLGGYLSYRRQATLLCCATMLLAALATVALTLLQAFELSFFRTALLDGANMALWLYAAIVVFALCAAAAGVFIFAALRKAKTSILHIAIGCIFVFVGIFALRIAFYSIHMTVGL
ncbi:MAG: dimethyl sulfoxide reductase anchor subunit [Coriobacteriales bacterium]|jgi:anaerobic dimethyl sulfoxide reductase subunit C (anchor subunit)|nr:dimethyl sulfoxide reductase anchor subunit [Coriobacteriales bacterium]